MTTAVSPVLDRLRHATVRPTEVVRAAYGLVELVAPAAPAGRVLGVRRDRAERAVARLLGARHLTQAVLTTLVRQPARTAGRRRGGCAARGDHGRLGGRRPPPGSAGLGRGAHRDPVRRGRAGAVAASARPRPWVGVRPPGRRVRPLDDTGGADGRLGGRGLPEAGRARAPEPRAGAAHAGCRCGRASSPTLPVGAGARRPATWSGSCSRSWRAAGCPRSRPPGSGPWPPTRRWAASTSSARRRSATPGCRCPTVTAAADAGAAGPGRPGTTVRTSPAPLKRSVDSG